MKELLHVGLSSPIHDGMAKATGSLKYYGDLAMGNLHYAKVVFSTVAHAVIKKVNDEEAYKVDGVVKILTCFNTTDKYFCRGRVCASEESCCQEQVFPKVVKFIGDRVAMVIAKTPEAAKIAANLITVEYEELPVVPTIEAAMSANAYKIYPEGNVYDFPEMVCGELPQDEDLQKVCSDIKIGGLHHAAMETHGCIADYDKYSNKLIIYTPCQSVFAIRTGVADLFDLPYSNVRVLQTTMGGSFGSKQETILEPVAAAGALAIGAPVKLVYTREEVITSTIIKAPMKFSSKALVKPNGKIKSLEIDCTIHAGAYLTNSLDYLYAMGDKISRMYDIDHIRFTGRAVCCNTPVSGSYRSWGSNDIAVALDQVLWKISHDLGLDLLEVHKVNAIKPYMPHRLSSVTVGDCRIEECFEKGDQVFEWEKRKNACREWNQNHDRIKKGVGMAGGAHVNGFYPDMEFAHLLLKLNEDGSILANVCLHDHGCGTITAFKKIIAEILKIQEDKIFINRPDTDYNFWDYGCYGSRTVYVIGKATMNAATSLLADLREKAAVMLNGKVDSLIYTEEGFVNPTNNECVSLAEISQYYQERNEDIYCVEKYRAVDNPTSSGAHFVQLAVDTLTGLVKIEKYNAVYDIGKAINPGMCYAQIGGAVQHLSAPQLPMLKLPVIPNCKNVYLLLLKLPL